MTIEFESPGLSLAEEIEIEDSLGAIGYEWPVFDPDQLDLFDAENG